MVDKFGRAGQICRQAQKEQLAKPDEMGVVADPGWTFWKIKTFWLLIASSVCFAPAIQGFVNFGVIWLHYVGYSNQQAAFIETLRRFGASLGFLASGYIGDYGFSISQMHGRPIAAFVVMLASVPYVFILFSSEVTIDGIVDTYWVGWFLFAMTAMQTCAQMYLFCFVDQIQKRTFLFFDKI